MQVNLITDSKFIFVYMFFASLGSAILCTLLLFYGKHKVSEIFIGVLTHESHITVNVSDLSELYFSLESQLMN